MQKSRHFVAVDPATGRHLRAATVFEAWLYLAQCVRPVSRPVFRHAFLVPIRVGSVLIDEDTGPGLSSQDQGAWAWLQCGVNPRHTVAFLKHFRERPCQ